MKICRESKKEVQIVRYRIAELTIYSQIVLPSFERFATQSVEKNTCDGADVSVVLSPLKDPVPEGDEVTSGYIVQRKLDDGWYFHSIRSDELGLLVSPDYTRLQLVGHEAHLKKWLESKDLTRGEAEARSEEIDFTTTSATYLEEAFIRMAVECSLAQRGYVSLHAACIELDGAAYAFSGPSGTGKSTRARAWMDAFEEAELVSGDRPLIDVKNLEAYGVPWDGKEGCYRNVHYPLKAIFDVRRKETVEPECIGVEDNSTRAYIRQMTFEQKRKLLMRQCFIPMWDTETAVIQMMNIANLASTAPIMRAFCGREAEDAAALKAVFDSNQYKKEGTDMKAKEGFVLRNIAGEKILMPTGDNIGKFKGTVLLNDVSAFIWEKMQNPVSKEDLIAAILDEFEVEESVASKDLDNLLATFEEMGVIEKD